MYCFRSYDDTPANNDTALYYLRYLLKERNAAENIVKKANELKRLCLIHKKTFEVGDVVLHKKEGTRALVIGWDFDPEDGHQRLHLLFDLHDDRIQDFFGDTKKDDSSLDLESLNRGWVSSFKDASAYDLVTDPLLQRLDVNKIVLSSFSKFDAVTGRFVPTQKLKLQYPDDTKHLYIPSFGVDSRSGISDPEGMRLRRESSMRNVQGGVAKIFKGLDTVLEQTIDAVLKKSSNGKEGSAAGSALSTLIYLDSLCSSIDDSRYQDAEKADDGHGLYFIRDRFRAHFRKALSIQPTHAIKEEASDPRSRRLAALERDLTEEFLEWKEEHEGSIERKQCYRDLKYLSDLYSATWAFLLVRFKDRSELLNALYHARNQIFTPSTEAIDKLLQERVCSLGQSYQNTKVRFVPGDVVYSTTLGKYYVCLDKLRSSLRFYPTRPPRRMGEEMWQVSDHDVRQILPVNSQITYTDYSYIRRGVE